MGQNGSVGTADTDYELNGQRDRGSIAGSRSSDALCSMCSTGDITERLN